jgi:hypothetical protein
MAVAHVPGGLSRKLSLIPPPRFSQVVVRAHYWRDLHRWPFYFFV